MYIYIYIYIHTYIYTISLSLRNGAGYASQRRLNHRPGQGHERCSLENEDEEGLESNPRNGGKVAGRNLFSQLDVKCKFH